MPLSIALVYDLSADPDRVDVNAIRESVDAISAALQLLGHRTNHMCVSDGLAPFIHRLESDRPDVVFNLCESFRGESTGEPAVAGLLELLELPYTGSGAVALSLALDKPLCKTVLRGAGLPTPAWQLYTRERRDPDPPAWPVILKLATEDASLGITAANVVSSRAAFEARLTTLFAAHAGPVMAESFIDGREFTVPLLDGEPLLLEEIEFSVEPRIVCYAAKWDPGSREFSGTRAQFSPVVSEQVRARILALAREVYALIGMRDYGRVDFRVDADERAYVLEANPNPDITPGSGYCQALDVAGIAYIDFIDGLVRRALARRTPDRRAGRRLTNDPVR
jgi:D-alanine-D-alanine ligase